MGGATEPRDRGAVASDAAQSFGAYLDARRGVTEGSAVRHVEPVRAEAVVPPEREIGGRARPGGRDHRRAGRTAPDDRRASASGGDAFDAFLAAFEPELPRTH